MTICISATDKEENVGTIDKIIRYNRLANAAIYTKKYRTAAKYLCKLHELEHKDKAELGAYRLRGVI